MDYNLMQLHNVSFSYPSSAKALNDISLSIPKGKKIALLGANGAGKSTLMLLLNGVYKPSSGIIEYANKPISYKKKGLRELRKNIGLVFQNSDNQLIAPTVYEEISFGPVNLGLPEKEIRQRVEETIKDFCLDLIQDKSPHQLSAGQKKRVCLASVFAMQPEFIICDEPASSLDSKHSQLTFHFLDRFHQQGKTILISTHDVNHAYTWADHIIVMKEGEILCSGNPKEVFLNKELLQQAELSQPFLVELAQAINPNIASDSLPNCINSFKTYLKEKKCKDLL